MRHKNHEKSAKKFALAIDPKKLKSVPNHPKTFIFNQKLHLGAMYRSGDAAGILLGFQVNNQFYAGYSFDWSFVNSTGTYNNGSHELMLRYDFLFKNQKKIKSPRYF